MTKRSRWLCLLLCFALLPLSLLAQTRAEEQSAPTIRVLLRRLALTDRADLRLDGSYTAAAGNGAVFSYPRGSQVIVQIRDGQLYLFYEGMSLCAGKTLRLTRHPSPTLANDGIRFQFGGSYYPGDLSIAVADGMLQCVLTLSVEDYLLGVVPYEMSDTFPLEALKAQAVCARTYALSHVNPSAAWDVVDTTNDQVFKGVDPSQTNAVRAVRETAGIVGMYKGKLASCYYAASNGGQTELVQNVWPGQEETAYYAIVDDPYDLENPESIVRRTRLNRSGERLPEAFASLLFEQLTPALTRLGYVADPACFRVNSINSVAFSNHARGENNRFMNQLTVTLTWSGRKLIYPAAIVDDEAEYSMADVIMAADGTTPMPTVDAAPSAAPQEPILSDYLPAPGEYTVTLPLFPNAIRALSLSISGADNELMTVIEQEDCFVLESRRYGHGVGMSQRGAQWMAGHYNMPFNEILNFYYPGMELMVAPAGPTNPPTMQPNLANTPGPSATPTPRPTLMPVSQPIPTGAYLASVENIEDDSSLNLRSEPTLAGEILMRLYKHQQLVVLGTCEDPEWVHVRTDSIEGYVKLSFLIPLTELTEAAPSPTPELPAEG